MSFQTRVRALAAELGVNDIPLGKITRAPSRSVDEVIRALHEHNFKFLGFYDDGRFVPQPNTLYLKVNEQIVGAKHLEPTEKGIPLIKPDAYKDSDSRTFYPL